jgi:hypothetical protein
MLAAPRAASRLSRCINHPPRLRFRTFTSTPKRSASSYFSRTLTAARYTGYFCLSATVGVFAIGAGFFIHDAFTYTDKHVERVPISPLALHPELGGPKNLPVVRVLVDDEEDEEHKKLASKPRLIIVGGGWGVRITRVSRSCQC